MEINNSWSVSTLSNKIQDDHEMLELKVAGVVTILVLCLFEFQLNGVS